MPEGAFAYAGAVDPARFRPPPRSIVTLVRDGVLDAELAALLWLLVGGRTPLLVAAGPRGAGKTTLLEAALALLPPDARRIDLDGRIDVTPIAAAADPARDVLVAAELSSHLPFYLGGPAARVALGSAGRGVAIAATLHADSLEEVIAHLRSPAVGLGDDAIAALGTVVILRAWRETGGIVRRVVAVHYLRPLARDAGGHVRRVPPAVLATWEPRTDRFEHFAWGVADELAGRVGLAAAEFERERGRRADYLDGLARAGITEPADVAAAIAGYRAATGGPGRSD